MKVTPETPMYLATRGVKFLATLFADVTMTTGIAWTSGQILAVMNHSTSSTRSDQASRSCENCFQDTNVVQDNDNNHAIGKRLFFKNRPCSYQ